MRNKCRSPMFLSAASLVEDLIAMQIIFKLKSEQLSLLTNRDLRQGYTYHMLSTLSTPYIHLAFLNSVLTLIRRSAEIGKGTFILSRVVYMDFRQNV